MKCDYRCEKIEMIGQDCKTCQGNMAFEEMKAKADSFFEFPTENRDHVTTTSAVLFALEAYKSGVDAANTLPHRAMFDAGIRHGEMETAKWILNEIKHHTTALAIDRAIRVKFGLEI